MSAPALAILNAGLVTSVGLSAATSCAAIRAKISNPAETRFIDSNGEWIMAHQVELEQPWRGLVKLTRMAAMAIDECLADIPRTQWPAIPLILCVAERERPGRLGGLDDRLFQEIEQTLGTRFAPTSAVVAQGRVSVAVALAHARKLIHEDKAPHVVIAAADSLLCWSTLSVYERQERLLTQSNSNGFMPGEGGGALLLARPDTLASNLLCAGIGFWLSQVYVANGGCQRCIFIRIQSL